jgi:hypothetical protein
MSWAMGYSLSDNKIHKEFVRELQIPQIIEVIEYRRNWKDYVGRISYDRIQSKILKYRPTGKGSF